MDRRGHIAVALVAAALALQPAAAAAATLTDAGATLTYSAAPGAHSDVVFSESAPGTVRVTRLVRGDGNGLDDDAVIAAGCTELAPAPGFSAGTRFDCPGVQHLAAGAGDLPDRLNARGLTTIGAALSGGPGEDALTGGGANDTLDGGEGDDVLDASGGGDDVVRGGPGLDATAYTSESAGPGQPPPAVSVTLDGRPDDGQAGEHDNVLEVEDVSAGTITTAPEDPSALTTVVGDASANTLSNAGSGPSDLDGGAGNDALYGGNHDDILRARDGFADRVVCGGGADVAIVDQLDTVSSTCETVEIAVVGNATEDRAPAVAFARPAQGARLRTGAPITLEATASDDQGVAKVQFLDDDRIVCEDAATPYTCAYRPRGEDVGRNTLVAVAIDTAQQTASAVRTVTVGRFRPSVSLTVSPRRDRRGPFSFRAAGRVAAPASVSARLACSDGLVAIQVKAGRKTISNRRTRLTRRCRFSQRVRFRSRARFARGGKLTFVARYAGNDVLARAASRHARALTH